jgi:hypothetical protein
MIALAMYPMDPASLASSRSISSARARRAKSLRRMRDAVSVFAFSFIIQLIQAFPRNFDD